MTEGPRRSRPREPAGPMLWMSSASVSSACTVSSPRSTSSKPPGGTGRPPSRARAGSVAGASSAPPILMKAATIRKQTKTAQKHVIRWARGQEAPDAGTGASDRRLSPSPRASATSGGSTPAAAARPGRRRRRRRWPRAPGSGPRRWCSRSPRPGPCPSSPCPRCCLRSSGTACHPAHSCVSPAHPC